MITHTYTLIVLLAQEPIFFKISILTPENNYIYSKKNIYTPKVWGDAHVDLQVFNTKISRPSLTIISFSSLTQKKLTSIFCNK